MIDHSNWIAYKVGDLFSGSNTGNVLLKDVEDGSGTTPYVTSSAKNNGVVAHIKVGEEQIIKGHCILVGGKTFTLTYQKENFVSNDSHNIVIRLKNENLSEDVYFFLVSVIRKALSWKYEWNDAITKSKLLDEIILLPSNGNEPNWEMMENTIQTCRNKARNTLEDLYGVAMAK